MSHGVHAVQHEVEHEIKHGEEHRGGNLIEGRNKKVALLIAIIALCLAFSETLGKSAQTSAISYNVEAANLWAFYQAKTIRQTALQVVTEVLKLEQMRGGEQADALKKTISERIDNWTKTAARYESEAKRDTSLERYHHYEVASAAFQIGIVLASATVITGMVLLTWLAGGLALIGVAFLGIGLFAPHAVHLF